MNSQFKKIAAFASLSLLVLAFQNCDQGVRFVSTADLDQVVGVDADGRIEGLEKDPVIEAPPADNIDPQQEEEQAAAEEEYHNDDDSSSDDDNVADDDSNSGSDDDDNVADDDSNSGSDDDDNVADDDSNSGSDDDDNVADDDSNSGSDDDDNVADNEGDNDGEDQSSNDTDNDWAGVNLLVNGDFEMEDSRKGLHRNTRLNDMKNKKWDVFSSLPGLNGKDSWVVTVGPGVEIQKNTIVKAQSGNNYVELDSHGGKSPNSNIVQTVYIPAAGNYLLTFYHRARTSSKNDNGVSVLVNGSEVLNVDSLNRSEWLKYIVLIKASVAGDMDIEFRATGKSNSMGGFIDNASLVSFNPLFTNK